MSRRPLAPGAVREEVTGPQLFAVILTGSIKDAARGEGYTRTVYTFFLQLFCKLKIIPKYKDY